ncbi:MAG: hypothetical protein JSR82_00170 [Verrucomicrobia bacterium]|nr:hypothetical protein [Verrucomicrobiota bacterium]
MKPRLFAAALAAALLLPRFAPAALAPDLAAAEVAPGDALLYLSLPDPKRSIDSWKGSALYKIWQEPEVQTFFGKPISQIPPIPDEANAVLSKLDTLQPRNLFVAFTSFDQKTPSAVLGFQFEGGRPALDPVLEKPIASARKSEPDGKSSVVTHGNRTIEVFSGKNKTLALCVADKWCFLGSSVEMVKGALDRYDKKAGAANALAETPEFKGVIKRLPERHDSFAYVFAPPLAKLLLETLEQTGTKINAEAREQLAALKALGATTALVNGQVKDTIFGLGAAGWAPGKISQRSMSFTTGETLLYFTSMLRFPEEPKAGEAQDTTKDKGPRRGGQEPVAKLLAELEAAGLPLREIKEAIMNEASLQLDWPNGAPWPSAILSLELKDRATAVRLIDRAVAKAGTPKGSEWKIKVEDGVEYRSLTAVPQSKPLTPTIAITDKHVLLGLSPTELRSAVVRARSGNATRLDGTSAFKDALAGVTPDQTLLYLNLRGLFEKAYGMARGLAPAVSDNPSVTKMVDLDKLPNTESIARHLVPLILTTERTEDGILLKSSGVLSAPQLLVGTFAGVGFGVNMFKAAKSPFDPAPRKGKGGRGAEAPETEGKSAAPEAGRDATKGEAEATPAAPKKPRKN